MVNNTQLVNNLKARVEVVEEIGGSIGSDPKTNLLHILRILE